MGQEENRKPCVRPRCVRSLCFWTHHGFIFVPTSVKTMPSKAIAARKAPQKKKPAAKAPKVKHIPDDMHPVTPHLICGGAAAAIQFYKKAFNAVEEGRLPAPDGRLMHAMIRINGSAIMLVDEMPEWGALGPKKLKGSPVTIHLYVQDVDAVVAQAVAAGAKITMPVDNMFWGDRYGKLEDPFGHQWSIATHQRDVTPAELKAGMAEMCNG